MHGTQVMAHKKVISDSHASKPYVMPQSLGRAGGEEAPLDWGVKN